MNKENWAIIIALLAVALVVFLIRFMWAEVVYHDRRCVFAECRINK